MTILKRNKGSFALQNLQVSDPKFVTSEFGASIVEEEEAVVEDEKDSGNNNGDVLISIIGEFGKYQMKNIFLMGITGIIFSWMNFSNKFITYEVDYWCQKPSEVSNMSLADWRNISAPLDENGDFDKCRIFDLNFTDTSERPDESTPTVACTLFEFAQEPFQNTVMQRWSLVCDKDIFFKSISQSLFFAGHFFGTLLAGIVADRFGRKRAFILVLLPSIGLTLTSYFVDNPYGWMALRFFIGIINMAATTIKAVYVVEWTSGIWRSFAQHYFIEVIFLISQPSMALLVYLVPDMKTVELIIVCGIVPFLSYTLLLNESPRWLLSKGRIEDAKILITNALKMNKLPLSRLEKLDKIEKVESATSNNAFYTDLFKYPGIRRNLICMAICWFTYTMGYYGLIYNTPSFGWNIYITFSMPAFFNFPVLAIQPFMENKFGRKPLLTFLMFLSGALLMCSLTIPDGMFDHNWPIMAFAWVGTVACSTAFGVGSVYTKELFPTTHRAMAISIVSAFARIGSISSPYVAMLEVINPIFALALYGSFLIFGGFVSLGLWPDTKKHKIPDTLEECEAMSSKKSSSLSCCK